MVLSYKHDVPMDSQLNNQVITTTVTIYNIRELDLQYDTLCYVITLYHNKTKTQWNPTVEKTIPKQALIAINTLNWSPSPNRTYLLNLNILPIITTSKHTMILIFRSGILKTSTSRWKKSTSSLQESLRSFTIVKWNLKMLNAKPRFASFMVY